MGGAAAIAAFSPLLAACGSDEGSSSGTTAAGGGGSTAAPGTTPGTSAAPATSPGTAGSGGTKKLAFGHPHASGAFYAVVKAGAEDQSKALGYELLQSRANGALDAQIAEVQTWIAQKVDAMTILALDINAMAPFVKQAHDAGIVFVCYAQSIDGADGYVTFDDASAAPQVGTMAADWINTKLGGNAKVAFMGDYSIQNNVIRLNPAKEALLKAAPKAQVVYEGKGLLAPEALASTQTLLQQHPDLKLVICAADDGALGASQAFTTSGKDVSDVWIAGYDGSQPAMEKAITGTDPLRLVAALPLYEIGQMVVTIPDNVLKKSGDTNYKAPYTMVSVETAADGQKLIDDFKAHTG
jgi:ribose transport system substrate-binding protein